MAWLVSSAALIAVVLLAATSLFQLLLALGLPFGRAAWGGGHRVLPARLRVGSAVAAAALIVAAWVLATEAGWLPAGAGTPWSGVLVWVFAGFFALNTLGNAVSSSPIERRVMTPITVVLVVAFVVTGFWG